VGGRRRERGGREREGRASGGRREQKGQQGAASRLVLRATRAAARQQEPAHWGMVDVSRRAGRPVAGSVVLTHSSITARGDSGVPEGLKLLVGGSTSGSSESGSATASVAPSG